MLRQVYANTALYKTREATALQDREFYQITVKEFNNGYVVTERHGWFDESEKKPKQDTTTLNDSDYTSLQDAIERHNTQVHHRVSQGFKHECFLDFDQLVPKFMWRDLTDFSS